MGSNSRGAGADDADRSGIDLGTRDDSLFLGLAAICETSTRLTGVDGAAVAVMTSSGVVRELVHATDALAQQIDELQFTLGEGPCLDAYRRRDAELCAQLTEERFAHQWPIFVQQAVTLGVAALFAFPVPGELHPMGVLELYRRTAGELDHRELQSASVCATAIRAALESNWRAQLARSGDAETAAEDVAGAAGAVHAPDRFTRSQVYVAAGMIAVQLSISSAEGLARLRAHAFAEKRSVLAVAADVVNRRLSFADLDDEQDRGEVRK